MYPVIGCRFPSAPPLFSVTPLTEESAPPEPLCQKNNNTKLQYTSMSIQTYRYIYIQDGVKNICIWSLYYVNVFIHVFCFRNHKLESYNCMLLHVMLHRKRTLLVLTININQGRFQLLQKILIVHIFLLL